MIDSGFGSSDILFWRRQAAEWTPSMCETRFCSNWADGLQCSWTALLELSWGNSQWVCGICHRPNRWCNNCKINFWFWIHILRFKNLWNLPTLSLALFFLNNIAFWTFLRIINKISYQWNSPMSLSLNLCTQQVMGGRIKCKAVWVETWLGKTSDCLSHLFLIMR